MNVAPIAASGELSSLATHKTLFLLCPGTMKVDVYLDFAVRKTVAKTLTKQPLSVARKAVVEAKYEIHKGRGRSGGGEVAAEMGSDTCKRTIMQ